MNDVFVMDVDIVFAGDIVLAGGVIGLCGVVFVAAFHFKSIKGPIGILSPIYVYVSLPYEIAVGWHWQSLPCV